MYHWITIIGTQPIAALNTLWYFKENFPRKPINRFSLFLDGRDASNKRNLNWFKERSQILCDHHKNRSITFDQVQYEQRDVEEFRKKLKHILHQSEQKVIIDMTSGRKAHSALLLLMGELFSGTVEHVFYNFLEDDVYMKFPYPALPPNAQKTIDLLER